MSGFNLCQNNDGADFQSQAVLAYVRYKIGDGLNESWDQETKRHLADIRVVRFDNCREQGYVIFMRDRKYDKQINIAFYEHRNSDSICAVVFVAHTFNAPVLEDITKNMNDKYDTTFSVPCGQTYEMAEFIVKTLTEFWVSTSTEVKHDGS